MSLNLTLKRRIKKEECTIGDLYVNNTFLCNTLEDRDRFIHEGMSEEEIGNIKVYGQTAIPYGTYKINMNTVSPKFKDRYWAKPFNGILPRLENVKGFEGVLIHVGNYPKDTLGCILVGTNFEDKMVINSTSMFNSLMNILLDHKDGGIILKIE